MPNKGVIAITVRSKAALTTDFVMATEAIYTDADNTEDANQDFSTTGANADREWMARKFTPTADMYVSTVTLVLGKTGSPAGTLTAEIFSDDGGATSMPDAQLTDSLASDSITCNDLSSAAGGASVTFRWTRGCPFVEAGTDYWVVIKSTGYTYSDGVTEVRWRTDADGATGLNECAKYDANAATTWTTIGANVGADLTVSAAIMLSVASVNQMLLYADLTRGSSDGARIRVEFSEDRINWFQESRDVMQGNVLLADPVDRAVESETQPPRIAIPVGDSYARISCKALTDATNAQLGITAILAYR